MQNHFEQGASALMNFFKKCWKKNNTKYAARTLRLEKEVKLYLKAQQEELTLLTPTQIKLRGVERAKQKSEQGELNLPHDCNRIQTFKSINYNERS